MKGSIEFNHVLTDSRQTMGGTIEAGTPVSILSQCGTNCQIQAGETIFFVDSSELTELHHPMY